MPTNRLLERHLAGDLVELDRRARAGVARLPGGHRGVNRLRIPLEPCDSRPDWRAGPRKRGRADRVRGVPHSDPLVKRNAGGQPP